MIAIGLFKKVVVADNMAIIANAVFFRFEDGTSGGVTGPDDLAVAAFPEHEAALLLGRAGHPLRRRERGQLLALVRIADRAWQLLGDYNVASAHDRHASA